MGTDLPHPITTSDELIKAVHDRLVEQNDLLRQLLDRTPPVRVETAAGNGGAALITEPAPPRTVAKKAAPAAKQLPRR